MVVQKTKSHHLSENIYISSHNGLTEDLMPEKAGVLEYHTYSTFTWPPSAYPRQRLSFLPYGSLNNNCQGFRCLASCRERWWRAGLSVMPERLNRALTATCHFFPQTEQALQEHKQQSKLIFRRITPNAEPRCSIESGPYTLQFVHSQVLQLLTV